MANEAMTIGTYVGEFGAKGNNIDDDSIAIQAAINYRSANGGGDVLLMSQHIINKSITIPSNIRLKGVMFTKIKSTNSSYLFGIPADADKVEIEGITFDYESLNSNIAILVNENVTNLNLNNLEFKNFIAGSAIQQNVIRLKTGIQGNISHLTFKNIKCTSNGITGDSGGAGRCIRTDSYGVKDLRNYSLNISNIHIEDCFSVDENGNFIIEDFDAFHFQHIGVSGTINVSNVTAKNFSKRLMKFEADGVNVTNVVAESEKYVPWLFAVMSKNINISTINIKGNIEKIVEFVDAKNVNINVVFVESNFEGINIYSSLFTFYNSSNINISQVSGKGYGGFLFYGKITENIYIDKVNLKLKAQILYIQDRDSPNTTYTDGRISNINFSEVFINVPTTVYSAPLLSVNGLGTVNPISQINFRDFKIVANQFYQYGLVRFKYATEVTFDNLIIENKSDLTNPVLINADESSTVQIRGLKIMGKPTSKEILVSGTGNLLVTRSNIANAQLTGIRAKLELEKTPGLVSYLSGATSAQLTIS
ncbi:hypothetical protein P4601_20600 [Peribacillus frigoritolerans]|uniref:hypothetical protein n=1 Tax=Peribacillus frigoritolerans TaxID=450367 RepID=UPI002E1B5578|nr:hypothetical protein [Peribacillus frigoritolerans]